MNDIKFVDIEQLKHEIVERLKPLNLYKIILFGSYANGNPTEDSDIDLYTAPMENETDLLYSEYK